MSLKIVIIGNIVPEPNSSAAGKRIIQLMTLCLDFGYQVQFWSECHPGEFSFDLRSLNIDLKVIQTNDESIVKFLIEENPKVVLFDRFMSEEKFGWRVAEILPETVRILDSEDLHFLRDFRLNKFLKTEINYLDIVSSDIFQREISSMYRCDLILTISEFEMKLLIETIGFPAKLLYYLPILTERTSKLPALFEKRNDFCFIGNFYHKPNIDCVSYLKNEIWPLIKLQLPESKLYIYGAYVNQNIFNLQDKKSGFVVIGRADSVIDVFSKHKVLLAPLRFGAGLKGKLIDAMENGIPSITTSIGAEGISCENYWNGIVSNNPVELANAAICLHNHKLNWIQSQIKGYKIINSRFDKQLFAMDFKLRLEDLFLNIKAIRRRNFIGAILLRNQNLATKYMSKWIEEKNKKPQ